MKNHSLWAAAACAIAAGAEAQTAPTYSDLVYGPYDPQERQTLDFYIPEGVTDAPVVMWIHGGAWFAGDKSNPTGVQQFLDAGIAVASMNYRLSTYTFPPSLETENGTQWPGQLEDRENAFSFVRENGATYGYDGSRIASFGSSAGAHLSAWAGLALADDPDTRLKASVAWYPPSDLYEMDNDDDNSTPAFDAINHSASNSPESLLIGATVGENEALADAASPAVYATTLEKGAPLPSFLIMHGTEDPLVSFLQSQRLHDAIDGQGGAPDLELIFLDGLGHGGPGWDGQIPYVVNFVSQALGNGPVPVPLPASMPVALAGLGLLAALRGRRAVA